MALGTVNSANLLDGLDGLLGGCALFDFATMALICLAAGMNSVMGGLPMIIAVIAAAMPVGFNALVPPVVYGFDIDIANSAWVISTLFFIVVLSVVFIAA